ncbi:MAG: tRNA (N6-threonylcarbamoyladenosine(37)-N6)-methyltransferase TrmO [Candidatus Competibacterales bacterium]
MPQCSPKAGSALAVIGTVHTPFGEKFGIPRQPGLAAAAVGVLELHPPYNRPEAITGLEGFSHLWLLFLFHGIKAASWQPTVRPPRLGGQRRTGVFASRSPYRPNGLGLSAVALLDIDCREGVRLTLGGVDLLDGTPVVDIKPYLPYADAIPARGGYADEPPRAAPVVLSPQAQAFCQDYRQAKGLDLAALVVQVVGTDPRPAFDRRPRLYGLQLWDVNVRWRAREGGFEVVDIAFLDRA